MTGRFKDRYKMPKPVADLRHAMDVGGVDEHTEAEILDAVKAKLLAAANPTSSVRRRVRVRGSRIHPAWAGAAILIMSIGPVWTLTLGLSPVWLVVAAAVGVGTCIVRVLPWVTNALARLLDDIPYFSYHAGSTDVHDDDRER